MVPLPARSGLAVAVEAMSADLGAFQNWNVKLLDEKMMVSFPPLRHDGHG